MDIFEELNLHQYINAEDTFTKYGASCMPVCSLKAMKEISRCWVDLTEVQKKTGDAIARLTHNEAAYITNGAAGGLMICAAACIALDSEKMYSSLPEAGRRREIIVQRAQHNPYDKSLAAAGAKLVFVGKMDSPPAMAEVYNAITERTAAVAYFVYHGKAGSLPLEQMIKIAHENHVPIIVDAAAQNPPASNLWKLTEAGADMVIFSGGKTLRGPQDSGLVLGKREWIERCRRWGPPLDGVCRCCKTSREAIVGLYAAVKAYLARDEMSVARRLSGFCACFEKTLRGCGFAELWREEGPVGQKFPRTFGKMPFGKAEKLAEKMKQNGIFIGTDAIDNTVIFNPLLLTASQVAIVCSVLERCMNEIKEEKDGGN